MSSPETEPSQPDKDLFGPQNSHSNGRNRQRKNRGGRPTKASPGLFKAVLDDIAAGYTREQACAHNGISESAWKDWEKRPEYPTLRDHARANRLEYLLEKFEWAMKNKLDWRAPAWLLERTFPKQFGDPAKVIIHAEQHNWTLPVEKAREIHDREARLLLELKNEQEIHNNG